jgi:nicotinamidase-related amidase
MHDAGKGSLYDITAETGQISSEVAPVPGEPVIVKHHPSAFSGTDLDKMLRRVHCRELVLAGFMTHASVNATARDSYDLGYQTTIVANATATRDLPGSRGRLVPAAVLQSSSLAGIADLFALVVGKGAEIPA